ncbi:ABC transporter permease subunit [Ruthenibacterium lactatiformans]|uniref:ABC transporter permease subunit n=2 Tax=Ruthenibacterium lactatiformans TaxID=1550024 RepID=A0A6L6LQT3_9FIRM|nr:ABC transporter permease subunit [Ruthenibacterium lactatiformans]MTS20677.1 ABC transporter permease subunit [Ruthenibacterium lactatiformans]MTS26629.1 ABC transporter permease subunit [Ruthenibacterium lactatiformans]MTS30851.1 ABC transporter permease subunit [Ruthenibacterium lactatiformans]MTS37219.1 ABC transporter permease subunit [Ruthenibacterium lactatiformans]
MKQKKPVLPEEEKNRTRSRRNKRIKQFLPLYIMLLPGIVYLIINNYLPMGGLVIAFKKVNYAVGIFNSPWAGLSNFKFLFSNNDALNALRNTVLYNLGFILFGNILAITVAIALDCVKSKFLKRFSQVAILIPYLLSTVIVSYIVYAFLNPTNGFVNNSVLPLLGIDPIKWYNVPKYWPVILTIVYLWMSFGYSSILYYSTIIGIDKSLYEAAVMDGATTWQQICHVTLPSLKFTIITLVLLAVGRICYSDFGLFYQVPQHSGLLYSTTQTIDTFVYRALLELNDVGRSSAAGFLQSILGFIMVFTANTLVSRIDKESALF